MDSRHDQDWLELYRPHFDDPDVAPAEGMDAETQAAVERIQRADQQIREALLDVPIPARLQETVLERLRERRARTVRRRRWIRGVLAFATAASVAIAVFGVRELSQPKWDVQAICDEAVRLYRTLDKQQVAFPRKVARDFPFDFSSKRCVGVHQPKFLDIRANAYEFQESGGQARVLVIALPRQRIINQNVQLPQQSGTAAEGLNIWFFQSPEWVYVAVYERERDLHLFTARHSVTMR